MNVIYPTFAIISAFAVKGEELVQVLVDDVHNSTINQFFCLYTAKKVSIV